MALLYTLQTTPNTNKAANGADAIVASVDYRLAPEAKFPTATEDAADALSWLSSNAEWVGHDGRIALMGDSAGGNLAAVAAKQASRGAARSMGKKGRGGGSPASSSQPSVELGTGSTLRAQVLLSPVIHPYSPTGSHVRLNMGPLLGNGLITYMWNQYFSDPIRQASDPRAAPLLDELSSEEWALVPPAIVVTSHFDPLCDEGEVYAAHLASHGVEVHAARRLEMHCMRASSTDEWVWASLRTLLWRSSEKAGGGGEVGTCPG